MQDKYRNYFPLNTKDAKAIQLHLKQSVETKNSFTKIHTVAGCDLAKLAQDKLVCAMIVFTYPGLEIIERTYSIVYESFPYIPGYLSFREGPAIMDVWEKLAKKPDLLMCDGQGIAHPRGIGIASHIGVVLNIPTIGVAKKKLFGKYEMPDIGRGNINPLTHPKTLETIGAVLRTKDNVKPVFVSIGHNVDLDTAIEITLNCATGYRIPEPTRQADKYSKELKGELS